MTTRRLWLAFGALLVISFSVLGYYGYEIYIEAPPLPDAIVNERGETLFTGDDIRNGQNVWQSIGGQELGTVWGHGAYVAPDWTADWLHREAVAILDMWAGTEYHSSFSQLDAEVRAALTARLQRSMRHNTYQEWNHTLVLDADRDAAVRTVAAYYRGLFTDDSSLANTRAAYAMTVNTVKDPERMRQLTAFFFWASWSCVTQRPGQDISYTNNWPPDELIGNKPSGDLLLWTGFSVIMLLAGIGVLVFFNAKMRSAGDAEAQPPEHDPQLGLNPTPSMRATEKYFWIVSALILVQVLLGAITAHYGVEGNGFYGISLSSILPYVVTRTWHVQLAIFWIATSWLATGLYIAPAVSGHEPRFQRAGVNFLFLALLVIVVGSLAGEWMGVMQKLGFTQNFWFGHQGYEYVDLGRFWQLFLFIGLLIWLALLLRALLPALREPSENRQLLVLFLIASIAIAAFYGAGLMWGQHTHLTIAEYWRWWVVHLWVEGFFEVFATVVSAFLFVRLGLLKIRSATTGVLFSTIIYLAGGILGTFHHLYFTGTPTAVLAIGATFSALEVVPLVLMGSEAWHNLTLSRSAYWVRAYRWPIYCLISVAFWNLVGAGIFGFLINPPIALYYMQGLNTTPVHGHTALFGVYGMLGIGLMLFVLRGLTTGRQWKEGPIRLAFWCINIGLLLMVLLSVLPLGLAQTVASVNHGMWYARSAEFMQDPTLNSIRWLRVIGDTVFTVGAVLLAYFVIGLKAGWSLKKG